MTLLCLRYFVEIAERKNFSKAAHYLFVSQPTLSRQISELEEELGVTLFNRTGKELILTKAGAVCLEEAQKILQLCDGLYDKVQMASEDISGTLNVGYVGYIPSDIFDNLQAMADKYPSVYISYHQFDLSILLEKIMDDECDVIFGVADVVKSLEEIEYIKIKSNPVYVAVSSKHRLAQQESIHVSDLAREHFVSYERQMAPSVYDQFISLCLSNGFSPNIIEHFKDPQSLMLMVSSNKGIAFASYPNLGIDQYTYQNIFLIPLENCNIDIDLVLAYKKSNSNPLIPLIIKEFSS